MKAVQISLSVVGLLLTAWLTTFISKTDVDSLVQYVREASSQHKSYRSGRVSTPSLSLAPITENLRSLQIRSRSRSAARGSSNDTTAWLVGGLVILAFITLLVSIGGSARRSALTKKRAEELKKEAQDFFDRLIKTGTLNGPEVPTILQSGEKALLHEPSTLTEARSVRAYSGTGTRVKGIWLGGGLSTSYLAMKRIDTGSVTLTNERFIFDGEMEERILRISDIVSVRPWTDAIEISSQRRQKSQVYSVNNPFIWCMLINMIAKGQLMVKAPKVDRGRSQLGEASEVSKQTAVELSQEAIINEGTEETSPIETFQPRDEIQLFSKHATPNTIPSNEGAESLGNKMGSRAKAKPFIVSIFVAGGAIAVVAFAVAYYARTRGVQISHLLSGQGLPKQTPAEVYRVEELGYRISGPGASDPNRQKQLLSSNIERQLPTLRMIYQEETQRKPDLMGSFRIQFTIAPSGKVTKVQEVTSRVKDKDFKKAVMEEVYKWRFAEAGAGSVRVNYTLLFVPSGMDAGTVTRWEQATSSVNPERVDISKPIEGTRKSARPGKAATYLPSIPKVPALPTKSSQETPSMPQTAKEKSNLGTYEVLHTTSVFSEPRSDSPVVSSIEVGTRVNVVGFQGDWLEIRSKHGRPPGFIHKDSAIPESTRQPDQHLRSLKENPQLQESGAVSTKASLAAQYNDTYGDREKAVISPGGSPTHVGPKGGLYHYSSTGTKVYQSRSASSRSFGSRRR